MHPKSHIFLVDAHHASTKDHGGAGLQQNWLKPKAKPGVRLHMKRTDLPISSPCAAQWDTMTVRGRALFCDECQTLVHDLSRLQRHEAADFLRVHVGEQMCVKYSYDALGNVLFAAPTQATVIPASMLRPSVRALAAATALLGAKFVYDNLGGVSSEATTAAMLPSDLDQPHVPLEALEIAPLPPAEPLLNEPLVGSGIGQSYGSLGGAMIISESSAFAALAEPRATVKILPAKVFAAGLDVAIIRRFLKRNAHKVTYCYEQRLQAQPALHGTVVTTFTVAADGLVTNDVAAGVGPTVEQCVADVIQKIEFPKPRAGAVTVSVPLCLRVE